MRGTVSAKAIMMRWTGLLALVMPVALVGPAHAEEEPTVSCMGQAATVVGTLGDDDLTGTDGVDVIAALGGNDTIETLGGDDVICSDLDDITDGDDTVIAGDGNDSVDGGGGNDVINAGQGDDYLQGGPGEDHLTGGGGEDGIEGEEDDDLLEGSDQSYLDGGDGNDALRGGDYLDGGPGDDDLRGSSAQQYLDGGDGDDTLTGLGGIDEYGDGDYLDGGAGNDQLTGAAGPEYLDGGDGADHLVGGPAPDAFDAGGGNDVLDGRDLASDTFFDCGAGIDALHADPADEGVDRVGCDDPTGPTNQEPVAMIRASKTTGRLGTSVTLSAHESYDPDGNVVAYHWDIDSDREADRVTTVPETSVTFWTDGRHHPTLWVEDNEGATSLSKEIEIQIWDGDIDYVALGDSYAAGQGLRPYFSATNLHNNMCHQSRSAYSQLFTWTAPITRTFYACSGAQTPNFWETPQWLGEPAPQVYRPNLSRSTDLVSINIGGNDVGFAHVLSACGDPRNWDKPYTLNRDEGDCTERPDVLDDANRRMDALPSRLDRAFSALRGEIGRDTTVVVLGYPLIFPGAPAEQSCYALRSQANFNKDEQNWLRDQALRLNHEVANAARRHGYYFAGVVSEFERHNLCESGTSYINNLTHTNTAPGPQQRAVWAAVGEGSFHPTEAGQQAYARILRAKLMEELADGAERTLSGLPANP